MALRYFMYIGFGCMLISLGLGVVKSIVSGIFFTGVVIVCLGLVISCEKDFKEEDK